MNLSTLINTVNPYLEYAWVTTPATAAQSIVANTVTPLTLNTEVFDTSNVGSLSANQITLATGTYYFEGNVFIGDFGSNGAVVSFGLYNITTSSYVTRSVLTSIQSSVGAGLAFKGQITLSAANTFDLRAWANKAVKVANSDNGAVSSLTTVDGDQKTTIRLWKLA